MSLFIAMIGLVILSLAGIGFMRAVDTQSFLAGNLAFNRASVANSDVGMELARQQISAIQAASVATTCPGAPLVSYCTWVNGSNFVVAQTGYIAWADPTFDYRGANWNNAYLVNNAALAPAQTTALAGYTIQYFIHRMCELAWVGGGAVSGDPLISNCLTSANVGGISQGSTSVSNNQQAPPSVSPMYRITIRVSGPRNSLSYVQVWMN